LEELKDYSGEFRPNIRYEDFSKDVLARLLKAYCKELLLLDAYWQQEVENRLGSDAAFDDVAAYVKTCQMIASFAQDVFDYDFDLKSNNHAVLTVRHCPALVSLEKNAPEKIVPTCQVLEEEAMKAYTRAVNPAIQVRGLKVPPRKSRDEIACQWEFKIDQG